jgi:hypothetical protein
MEVETILAYWLLNNYNNSVSFHAKFLYSQEQGKEPRSTSGQVSRKEET